MSLDYMVDAVEQAYEKLDAALGRCLAELPDNCIVAVVSEHGMSCGNKHHGSWTLSLCDTGRSFIESCRSW